jgi:hypothetical protein
MDRRKKMDPKAFEKPGRQPHHMDLNLDRVRETDQRYHYFFKLNSGA